MPTHRRDRVFVWWAGVVSRHPIAILSIAWLLAAAAVAFSVTHWRFQSDRNLLISDKVEWHRRFIEMGKHFPGGDDLIVVVDAGPDAATPGTQAYKKARAAADELGRELSKSPYVAQAVWGADFSPRLLRLAPMDEVKATLAKIDEAGPMLESPTPTALLANIASQMMPSARGGQAADADTAASIDDFTRLLNAMAREIEQGPASTRPAGTEPAASPPADFGALMEAPGESNSTWQYLTSENNRLLFVRVTPKLVLTDLDALTDALAAIHRIVDRVAAAHPGVQAGVTGIGAMESEETAVATWDSTWTSLLAVCLIAFVLVTAFHSWRTPLMAMIALGTGIAWAYGFLFLTVGHLQVLSVVFNVMLLGLGIAYGIYLASAFELLRHAYPDDLEGFTATLAATFRTMGPGILTGSLTTAACFATTIFTDFTGVAEMGFIAGAGILLCFLAMFTVFPALLRLFKADHRHVASMESHYFHYFEERWVMPFVRHPVGTLVAAGLLTALSLLAIQRTSFDNDLVKLQPRNAPSVLWQQRIEHDGAQSIWSAISVADNLAEARKLTEKFRKLPTVGAVGGVGLLFPPDEAAKVALIKQARAKLAPALDQALQDAIPAPGSILGTTPESQPASEPAGPPASMPAPVSADAADADIFSQLAFLGGVMKLLQPNAAKTPPIINAALARLDQAFARMADLGRRYQGADRRARLTRLTEAYRQWRLASARQIALTLDPAPLTTTDLPHAIIADDIDDRGRLALEIYPSLTKDPAIAAMHLTSPLDPRFLGRFVHELDSVHAPQGPGGDVVQVYLSGKLIKDAYERAGLIALVIVYLIVMFDYRRLHDSLLIMLPVAMAFAITFGIMWCVGQTVNMANIIVLPLMFGIGVDSGIHVLNRYRQHPADVPPGLTRGTGKGVTITCLTSVISFACMILSSHRGISSLGFVLATGLLMTMFACWTVMPAWLALRQRGGKATLIY